MSSLTSHIAEQPNILAEDAEWRTTLTEVVKGLIGNMVGIKHLLNISTGDDDDARDQFAAVADLEGVLSTLRARQEAAVVLLEQHQEKWNAAVTSQDGRLAQLKIQLEQIKDQIKESEGTAQSMNEQSQRAESHLASLTRQLSQARADLAMTQAEDSSISQGRELERLRLSKLQADLTAQSTELDLRFKEIQVREKTVATSEVTVQQQKSRNDTAGQKLQSTLSILHSLANVTGSELGTVPTLDNIQDLAASIQTRIFTLQERISGTERTLTDRQTDVRTVEGRLVLTNQELGTLRATHQNEMRKFHELKAKSLQQGKKVEELREIRAQLATKTTDYDELLRRFTHLDLQHQTYSEDLDRCKTAHAKDKEHLSGLQSHSIPRLEATKKILQDRVNELTEENRGLRAARTASDVEVTQIKVHKFGLETTVQQLRTQLAQAEQTRNMVKRSFDTLVSAQATDASVNKQSLQTSEQALKEVKAINDRLNTRMLDNRHERQAATDAISALQTENGQLRASLTDRATECHTWQAAAGEAETKVTDLESRCKEKDDVVTRLENESVIAASRAGQDVAELKADIEARDSQLQALNERHLSLESESRSVIQALRESRQSLESEVKDSHSEIQALKDSRQSLESEVERKNSQIQDLGQARRELEAENDARIARLQDQLEQLGRDLSLRQGTVDCLTTSLAAREAENQRLEQQAGLVDGLHEQLSAKNAEIARSDAQYRKAAEDNHALAENFKEQAKLLESQLADVTASLQSVQQSNQMSTEEANDSRRESNRLQVELRALREITLPQKEALIEQLKAEAVEHRDVASTSRHHLREKMDDLKRQVVEMQHSVAEKDTELRRLKEDNTSLENAAERSSSDSRSVRMRLTDSQALIDTLKGERVAVVGKYNEMKAALQKSRAEQSDYNRTVKERDRLEDAVGEVEKERDDLLREVDFAKVELGRLTTQLQSCHCSDGGFSRKRRHEQDERAEDEAQLTDVPERSTRRVRATQSKAGASAAGASPSDSEDPLDDSVGLSSSRSKRQATTTLLDSEDQGEPSIVLQPGTRWRIEDVLGKDFTAPPIPEAIIKKLRGKIRGWDKQRQNWRAGSTDRIPKCAECFASRHGTRWVDGDCHRACASCTAQKSLCVAVTNHHVEILPANGTSNSGLGVADSSYWLGP